MGEIEFKADKVMEQFAAIVTIIKVYMILDAAADVNKFNIIHFMQQFK